MSMVLIDLPNFFNGLTAESSINPALTKAYFLDWLDLELMAWFINPDATRSIGTWVFYSNQPMGRGPARLSIKELAKFAERHNRITGISAMEVGIHGKQGESFKFACSNCGTENETQTQSEKGIDSSLITHLFDTMEHWKTATIVSQDADYCPAVRALRKRGKFVYGAGFIRRAAEALIRECFGYKDVMVEYLRDDLNLFLAFMNGGKLSRLFRSAAEINDGVVSSWISHRYKSGGGSWSLTVDPKGKIENSVLLDSLLDQAKEIRREFPLLMVTTEAARRPLINIETHLNPRQYESLNRTRERYLDFKVLGPEDTV